MLKVISAQKIDKNLKSTLVVFAAKQRSKESSEKKDDNAPIIIHCKDSTAKHLILDAHKSHAFTGKSAQTLFFRNANLESFSHLLVVGLGNESDIDAETLRRTTASAAKALEAHKIAHATLAIDTFNKYCKDTSQLAQAICEGAILSSYQCQEFKSGKKETASLQEFVLLTSTAAMDKAALAGIHEGTIIAESINFARHLGDSPGNLMTPTLLAKEAQHAARGTSLKVTVWDKVRIEKEKMGCLFGVSKGSDEEPRFIIMEYKGAAASQKPVCYVGKGLTFDAGGISIKPSAAMEEMKFDMCGGANTIATMVAIAKLKLKINAIAFVPASENLPGPSANKPGDILTARNGKTVEVNNTDAEGRLILADALVYACEQKPAVILDAATLTGAMVVALGNLHTGFFTRNDKLANQIRQAAAHSGEWVWQMPLVDEHGGDMKGTYADLSNIGSNKGAGSSQGAAFMENFVKKDIPWAHFDIAGTGWDTGARVGYNPRKGASGAMVRTWIEFAKNFKG